MGKKINISVLSLFLILLFISNSLAADEINETTVTIIGHHKKSIEVDKEHDILLDGVNSGEVLEIIIDGTIYNFKHLELHSQMSGENLVISETLLHDLGDLTNQRILIKTYLAEGVPSERIRWRGADGRDYEFTFFEDVVDGINRWEYKINSTQFEPSRIIYIPRPDNTDFFVEKLVPLGWSKDGKFAFIRIYGEYGGRGASIFEFTILDAVTDKIVFKKEVVPFDEPDFDWEDKQLEFAWEMMKDEFTEHLNSSAIFALGPEDPYCALFEFPLLDKGFRFSGRFDIGEENENKECPYQVIISRNDGAEKTSTEASIKSSESIILTGGFISGYFKSPYQARILMVFGLITEIPDWESSANSGETTEVWMKDYTLGFTGANLRVGF